MSVIWSGVTEEGAVVPVQVTAEGKVVAVGDGPVGEYLPITGGELTGDLDVDGSLTAADVKIGGTLPSAPSISLEANGIITAAGSCTLGGAADQGIAGVQLYPTGEIDVTAKSGAANLWKGRTSGSTAASSSIKADGSAEFNGNVRVNDGNLYSFDTGSSFYMFNASANTFYLNGANGSATFAGEVVIGSKGSKWLIRESNGVAMLIEATRRGQIEPRMQRVRDLPNELDLIEAALSEVMARLKMTPPAGWPVWDGNSETVTTTDNDNA